MLDVYTDFAVNDAAIPVIPGRKSDTERFAGAVRSYTIEAMMGDKRALQSGTSHFLGQNFARAFGTQFLDRNNELQYVWQTSWGVSTRMIGAIVMVHGDDQGLILPPVLAPIQAVIVPIWRKDAEKEAITAAAADLRARLAAAGVRTRLDDRDDVSPGFKFNDWEMRGVPLRVEIGPRDLAANQATLARRDTGEKFPVPIADLAARVPGLLKDIQSNLLRRATEFRDANTHDVRTWGELVETVADGFARAWWCGSAECEAKIKDETKATTRCIPFDQPGGTGKCVVCGAEAREQAIFARAY
jgi:prolyl-tRNA synthetase